MARTPSKEYWVHAAESGSLAEAVSQSLIKINTVRKFTPNRAVFADNVGSPPGKASVPLRKRLLNDLSLGIICLLTLGLKRGVEFSRGECGFASYVGPWRSSYAGGCNRDPVLSLNHATFGWASGSLSMSPFSAFTDSRDEHKGMGSRWREEKRGLCAYVGPYCDYATF